jgi:glutamyl-tRNA synthetase
LLVPDNTHIVFQDAVRGRQSVNLSEQTGDFVLRRGDGVYSYQLAVSVDDLAQGITEVVRGADLFSSTARQVFLMECLGGNAPGYAHAPLIVAPNGEKLAKRDLGVPVWMHREAGVNPKDLVARLAQALGLAKQTEHRLAPSDLIARFSWEHVSKGPIPVNTILD